MGSEKKKEYILCAAIWYVGEEQIIYAPSNISGGHVICGHRHHQIIPLWKNITGKNTKVEYTQGFLTSENRFLNRRDAAIAAYDCGQIKEYKNELYSEDLY